MASFVGVFLVIMSFMASPSLSLLQTSHDELKSTLATIISAAPAVLPSPSSHSSPSPLSSFTELSPDISPLFPKTGGKVPPPTSSIPTIPSNPSPPNPDEVFTLTPESALSPTGSLPVSSAVSLNFAKSLSSTVFMGILALVLAM